MLDIVGGFSDLRGIFNKTIVSTPNIIEDNEEEKNVVTMLG